MGMNIFQITGITIFAIFIIFNSRAIVKKRLALGSGVFWIALWVVGIVLLIFPNSTSSLARFFGITRGVDLIFYFCILAALFGFFMVYLRIRKLEDNITLLVRTIALKDAEK